MKNPAKRNGADYRSDSFWRGAICAIALAMLATGVVAQTEGPIKPKPGTAPEAAPQSQQKPTQLRVVTRLVSAPAVVRDSKGEMVLDLEQKDFQVFDNGVAQKVDHFDIGGDPISAVLLVETSTRIGPVLPAIQKAGIVFTDAVLGETGEGAVVSFDSLVDTVATFTSNYDALDKTIAKLPLGGDGARLYDGMSAAINLLRDQPEDRRRVIIAVSEGRDSGSSAKLGELLREAEISNITIYSIGLSTTGAQLRNPAPAQAPPSATPPGVFGDPPMTGTPQTPTTEMQRQGYGNLLNLAVWAVKTAVSTVKANPLEVSAAATGGEDVGTYHDAAIEKGLDRIAGELHAQYTISYHPTDAPADGFHEIKIQVSRPGLKVQTRPGYYLAPAGSAND